MNKIQKIIIFYFSGTGNSEIIAHWIADLAKEKNIVCRIQDITKANNSVVENEGSDILYGIISPVHGFNFPPVTLNFIRNLPEGKSRIVLMNTRAGIKVGAYITPGLTGITFILSSFILRKKGYKIIGQIPFDMPSNWISVHPALREKSVEFILEKNYLRVKKHFNKIYAGKKDFSSHKDIIQDILISPVALAYYFGGRYFFAKSYYASYACINCGQCIKQCPFKAITVVDKRPFWTLKCESCMKCMNNCPVDAIETAHGLWILSALFTSVFCSYFSYELLPVSFRHWIIYFLFFSFLLVCFLCIFYRIQQFTLRNKTVARLISFTSLTHYKFWGRYRMKIKNEELRMKN